MMNDDVIGKYLNDNRDPELAALDGLMKALDDQDEEAQRYWCSKIRWDAGLLLTMKKIAGAEGVRRGGYCTELADAAYGPGWLDRPEPDDA